METAQQRLLYESPIPFDRDRIGAAAVYCADGRFGDQIDDLLHHCLKLPGYDRLAIPGGAACLLHHFNGFFAEQATVEHLEFLIRTHQLHSVVLIAHQDCGYYLNRLHVNPADLEQRQRDDLDAARRRILALAPETTVAVFFARHLGDKVCFEMLNYS